MTATTGKSDRRIELRLLATTDIHASIVPYDYFRAVDDDGAGLARTASLVRAATAETPNALLLDNGDFIQGSALADYVADRKGLSAGDVHPVVAAMNTLPYMCATLGNHEFNYGLDFLTRAMTGATFPFVCANIETIDGRPLVEPWRVFERPVVDGSGNGIVLRVGVIGFAPPQIMLWDKGHLEGRLRALDILDAARKHMPELSDARPDLVVALCHSGIAGRGREHGEENAAQHLAELDGIDVVICGHQHLLFPGAAAFDGLPGVDNVRGALSGKPACQPGFGGSHIGVIDLSLEQRGSRWCVASFTVANRPVAGDGRIAPTDETVLAAVARDHEATLAYMDEPVGHASLPIRSHFALVADDACIQLVAEAQIARARELLADTPWNRLPVLSAAAPFKAGGRAGPGFYTDIPAGPLTLRHIADLYLYPNTLQVVKVTGAELREWLERAAIIFNRIDPSLTREQPLIDERQPAFNFDVIDGVSYLVDVTRPARYDEVGALIDPDARRISDLRYDGAPVDEAAEFLVATNNYRASGGGGFPGTGGTIVLETPDMVREVLTRHIRRNSPISPAADGNWRLAPLPPGVVATFRTSPQALSAPASLKAERLRIDADGFATWRLVT